jgi:transcriptional regulator with PAS, ATPase and Fis domain
MATKSEKAVGSDKKESIEEKDKKPHEDSHTNGGIIDGKKSKLDEIIGFSDFTKNLRKQIDEAANNNQTVLITGPSGTGKELIANNIHYLSKRSIFPYLPINCSGINERLFETLFFGIIGGLATDVLQHDGYLKTAYNGTIFLDEIGDLPPSQQPKLLRYLDSKRYLVVGESQETPSRARIIAATNKNLTEEIKAGRFRNDLYQRLIEYKIKTQPLQSRPIDVICLTNHFLKRNKDKYTRDKAIHKYGLKFLIYSIDLEGNVREIERYCKNGLGYTIREIEDEIREGTHITLVQNRIQKNRPSLRPMVI